MLEPDPEAPIAEIADDPPVQEDIVAAAEAQPSVKPALRAAIRGKRDGLSDKERNSGTRRIVERLLRHPDVHRAKTVLLYASYGSEVATDDLAKELMKRGKSVAYPKLSSVAGLMTLWRVKNLDALIPHKMGIRAPDVTRSIPIEPITVDCVIYPGLAFTKGLWRLGQGGGYYDRLSTKIADTCARIGICFESQIVDDLPHDEHDAQLHWVVTEATVYPYVPDPPVAPVNVLAPLPPGGGGETPLSPAGSGGEGESGASTHDHAASDQPPLPSPLPPGEREHSPAKFS